MSILILLLQDILNTICKYICFEGYLIALNLKHQSFFLSKILITLLIEKMLQNVCSFPFMNFSLIIFYEQPQIQRYHTPSANISTLGVIQTQSVLCSEILRFFFQEIAAWNCLFHWQAGSLPLNAMWEGTTTHSSILAWRIPWIGQQTVGQDQSDLACAHTPGGI